MEINVLQLSPSCSHAQLPTLPLSSYLKHYFDLNKNLTSGASESVTAVPSNDKNNHLPARWRDGVILLLIKVCLCF